MRLLEYEAKNLLKKYGIRLPMSRLLSTPEESEGMHFPAVIKTQVPVGGRGKAGGIIIVENEEDASRAVASLFKKPIHGYVPKRLLAEEKLSIKKEHYLSFIIDRNTKSIRLLARAAGGIEVEAGDESALLAIDTSGQPSARIAEEVTAQFGYPASKSSEMHELLRNLWRCFKTEDATLLEINPLVFTKAGQFICADCKIELDDSAAFRHAWNFEEKPVSANFVVLNSEGAVATMANGAGLAMATVDAVTASGTTAANFLDIGGGTGSTAMIDALQTIARMKNVRAIVINIFAGITRCDEVASAIIQAKKEVAGLPPLFIRLAGTNHRQALEMLSAADIEALPSLKACIAAAAKETSRV